MLFRSQAVKGPISNYNLAVANVCNGNLSAAKSALVGAGQCPCVDYLKAVICMKEGNSKNAVANLKVAIAKDNKYKAMAKNNVDFAKLFGTEEFLAL